MDWRNSNSFASCSTDKSIFVCKVGDEQPVKKFSGHTGAALALLCLCVFGLLCLCHCFRKQGVHGAGGGSKHGVVRRSRLPCDPRASGTPTPPGRIFRLSFEGGMREPADKYGEALGHGGGVDLGLGAAGSSEHACAPAR